MAPKLDKCSHMPEAVRVYLASGLAPRIELGWGQTLKF